MTIKKSGATNEQIYSLLGIKHQYLTRWRKDVCGTLTKNQLKHLAINKAGELFGLTFEETEALAKSAGLSLSKIVEASYPDEFIDCFNKLLSKHKGKIKELCELACVSERMFRYIRKAEHIRKEPLIALLLVLGADYNSMQDCLKKAGYVLSRSVPTDTVIMWMLENGLQRNTNPVESVNEILYSLGLPLLMTRLKSNSDD